ncbi:hypothetical protein Dda_9285 [Drechslerella dactyloides]|uniref:Phosphatidylinositol-specific phospholipase C X domain-containing protein n=1 Tax=Drechslerella dactyloides TaxID=74499 RepID=A0AAD6IS31_DREDA|nr:hypothetical protein Dda_9285 [Drechslerella dactyloides]
MHIAVRLLPLVAAAQALVPAPRLRDDDGVNDLYDRSLTDATARRGLGTSAEIYFINDWPAPITFTSSDSHYMSNDPPGSVSLGGFSASGKYAVDANGWIPLQSSFKVNMKAASESSVSVNIGMSPFKTGFTVDGKSPAAQAGVMLAPAKILSNGRDFDFYFFAGPGVVGPLINSVLEANAAAVFTNIKKQPMKLTVSNDIDILLKEIVNPSVKCSYASVTPVGNKAGLWDLNIIIDVTAEVRLNARFKKISKDANIKMTGTSLLATAQVDLGRLSGSNLKSVGNVGISITRFQTSIGDIKIDGDILVDIVGGIYPVLAPVLRLPYKLASIINTSENSKILTSLNSMLKSFGANPVLAPRWSTGSILARFKRFISSLLGPSDRSSDVDLRSLPDMARWMSNPTIQSRKLADLYLPGTHDSAAYAFTRTLSLMKYDDIAFLWNLEYYLPAPSDGSFNPLTMTPVHLGPILGSYVMNSVAHISKAQMQDIPAQLAGGIRHFDLRVYYDPTADNFYTQHALRAKPTLADIVAQVQTFVSTAGARELVILVVSHTNFNQDFTLDDGSVVTAAEVAAKFLDVVRPLEDWVYLPGKARGTKNFDFQTLQDTTVGEITQDGKSKVLILTPDFVLPEISVNTDGWDAAPSGATAKKGLYMISTAAALTAADIVGNVCKGLSGQEEVDLLEEKAKVANAALETTVKAAEKAAGGSKIQLVSVDWWEHGLNGKSAAQIIVGLNGI